MGGNGSGELTVVYIHGVASRDVGDIETRIRDGLRRAGLDARVVAAKWGQLAGPRFPDIRPLVPRPPAAAVARALVGESAADNRLVALRLELVAAAADLDVDGATPAVSAALRSVAASRELVELAARHPAGDPAQAEAVVRLVEMELDRSLARSPSRAAAARVGLFDGLLCRLITGALPPPGAMLFAPSMGGIDVSRPLTDALRRCRAALMQPGIEPITDLLHYQRRGGQIRDVVVDTISEVAAPVLVIGESLGGVIAADVLSEGATTSARGLVTVGSQVAVLYEMQALEMLLPGGPTRPFTPWLNIYNPFDFGSFLAAPSWPTETITDVAVDDGRSGFPDSHGAYWTIPATFDHIVRAARDWGLD